MEGVLHRHLDTRTYRKRFEASTQSVPRIRISFLSNIGQLAAYVFLDEATFRKLFAITEPWLSLPFSFSETFYQQRKPEVLEVLQAQMQASNPKNSGRHRDPGQASEISWRFLRKQSRRTIPCRANAVTARLLVNTVMAYGLSIKPYTAARSFSSQTITNWTVSGTKFRKVSKYLFPELRSGVVLIVPLWMSPSKCLQESITRLTFMRAKTRLAQTRWSTPAMLWQICLSAILQAGCALSMLGGPEAVTTHASSGRVPFLMHSSNSQPSYAKTQLYRRRNTRSLQMMVSKVLEMESILISS